MKVLHNMHPEDAKHYDSERLRNTFLCENLFQSNKINVVYSHIDRLVALGIMPNGVEKLFLDQVIDKKSFGTDFFLQRRELGIINLGGTALIETQRDSYTLEHFDALYLGKETENIQFTSLDEKNPAVLYGLSVPAHHIFPNKLIPYADARKVKLGSLENSNARVINQYLHPDVLDTCQLCMGMTELEVGSVWNTMPAHTHERRMEAYLYFNIAPNEVVFHFLGEPTETRHLVVRDKQLVISPSWSIHSGCGTRNYNFVWGMAGENQTFDDMDFVAMDDLR
ncbi:MULTISPECIES: 5-dehydro-4-deoxy-D-glucuronate isomerase [unclassified Avibacterium]|uniref:5-dehydro-4-deoxy-D-glucuronate isomerase n=1 Tax=unclassified Avibacterium TaxID=2685287 RepID=UPI0020262425|nr:MULTISPECIES: 5-dehydro-4-deoxy-D-glucuronate isomerase [unclassified Avibacterium]MCW9698513.1 5-dehydro-4-deoxy-D-glucuronate isomerase [Avibacterium sp. 20-129]URL02599.1 5-dehydro-4-deoxy-D-glucuronate isomerase [Avibacterium sp. 20-126]URL07253.1 5-dehydro-4-deoxy-D-glucuronate isomerase [Avibacterium sp. 21-595]